MLVLASRRLAAGLLTSSIGNLDNTDEGAIFDQIFNK